MVASESDGTYALMAPAPAEPSINESTAARLSLSDELLLPASASSSSSTSAKLLDRLRPYRRYIIVAAAVVVLLLTVSVVWLLFNRGAAASSFSPSGGGREAGGGGAGGGGARGGGGGGSDSGSNSSSSNETCPRTPVETEGPYWVDEKLNRSDLAATSAGLRLALAFLIYNASSSGRDCVPVQGAMVDLWQSDPAGLYSDEQQLGTKGLTYLRGYQSSNAAGVVSFLTVWPGWYSGRTAHIHIRVRIFGSGASLLHDQTTQIFFDDDVSDAIYAAVAPYSQRTGKRDTKNSNDHLFHSDLLVNVKGDVTSGYSGSFAFGVPFMR